MTMGLSRPDSGFRRMLGATIGLAAAFLVGVDARGADRPVGEPGWSRAVIATGDQRATIRALPIEQRPYRPLHFYGNTVRRMHYRGTPLPLPRREASAVPRRR